MPYTYLSYLSYRSDWRKSQPARTRLRLLLTDEQPQPSDKEPRRLPDEGTWFAMLIYFAIILVGLFGFCGLVVDVGRVELRSLQLQGAADSAALSAANEYQRTSNWGSATSAASTEAANNATLNNLPSSTVTTTLGALAGNYANDGSTVQVTITQPVSTTLLSLIKGSHSTLNASATGVAMIPPCLYLMGHPSMPWRGNNNLDLSSQGFNLTCPMYSSTGYYVDGFSNIRNWQAKAAGPASQSYGGGWTWPALIANSPVLADPLAYIVAPVFGGCLYHNATYNASTPKPIVITPGTYCGGLTINNTTVTMTPGLYIITGGVTISAGATVNGPGVTLYLTKGGGSNFGTFSADSSTLNLSAPNDASAQGIPAIVLMTDRAWVGGYQDISIVYTQFKGDGLFYITGTGIYNWTSPMSGYNYFGFVVGNFAFQNANMVFSCNYSQLPGGNPFHTTVQLVQ